MQTLQMLLCKKKNQFLFVCFYFCLFGFYAFFFCVIVWMYYLCTDPGAGRRRWRGSVNGRCRSGERRRRIIRRSYQFRCHSGCSCSHYAIGRRRAIRADDQLDNDDLPYSSRSRRDRLHIGYLPTMPTFIYGQQNVFSDLWRAHDRQRCQRSPASTVTTFSIYIVIQLITQRCTHPFFRQRPLMATTGNEYQYWFDWIFY